jgi:CHAT domain-containing protein
MAHSAHAARGEYEVHWLGNRLLGWACLMLTTAASAHALPAEQVDAQTGAPATTSNGPAVTAPSMAQAVALYDSGALDAAMAMLDAVSAADSGPPHAQSQAQRLNAAAVFQLALGRETDALRSIEEALALLADRPDASERLALESNRSVILSRMGRLAEARAEQQRIVIAIRTQSDEKQPEAIAARVNLAASLWRLNFLDEADAELLAALAVPEPSPETRRVLGTALVSEASIAMTTLRPALAMDLAQKAWKTSKESLGEGHPQTLRAGISHGRMLGSSTTWDAYDLSRKFGLETWAAYAPQDKPDPLARHFMPFDFIPVVSVDAPFIMMIDGIDGADAEYFAGLLRTSEPYEQAARLAFLQQLVAFERRRDLSFYANDVRSLANTLAGLKRNEEAAAAFEAAYDADFARFGYPFQGKDDTFEAYVAVLRALGREADAEDFEKRFDRARAMMSVKQKTSAQYYAKGRRPDDNLAIVEPLLASLATFPGEDSYQYADALNFKAIFLAEAGLPAEAIRVLEQAMAITRTALGVRNAENARLLGFYAQLLRLTGRNEDARDIYRLLVRLSGEGMNDGPSVFSDYIATLIEAGDLDSALVWTDRRLAILDRTVETQRALEVRAQEQRAKGQIANISPFDARLDTAELSDKARVLLAMGRASEAEMIAAEVVRRETVVLNGSYDEIEAHQLYGSTLLANGRYEQAEAELALAARLLAKRPAGEPLAEADIAMSLARAQLSLPGKASLALDTLAPTMARAEREMRSGLAILQRSSPNTGNLGKRTDLSRLLADANWSRAADTPERAALLASVAEQPAKIEMLQASSFAALQAALITPASRAVAQTAARRAAEAREPELGALALERETVINQWLEVDRQFAAVVGGDDVDTVSQREQLAADKTNLEARLDTINQQLRARAPDYFALIQPEPLDVAQAKALLAADEAALMLIPTEFGTHIMLVTSEGIAWQRSDWSQDRIGSAVQRLLWFAGSDIQADPLEVAKWTDAVDGGESGFDRDTAFALYQQLIAPVAPLLAGKRHLFIAASGALSSLSFAMLVTDPPVGRDDDPADLRATRWFGDRFALAQIPSLQSLALLRASAGPGGMAQSPRFIGFGDPVLNGPPRPRGNRGRTRSAGKRAANILVDRRATSSAALASFKELDAMQRLPGTATELVAMAQAFNASNASLFLAEKDTEAAIKAADLGSADILALATHGLIGGDLTGVSEPGLVFTPPVEAGLLDDGYLTASEVATLKLGAQWVILSACNTAAGDGSKGAPGLSGLARAFFYAGSRNLLVSHWPVRDDVAARLTVRAIALSLGQQPLSRAAALQRAMQDIRNDPTADGLNEDGLNTTWAHPGAWAPFALIGDSGVQGARSAEP